MHKTISVSLRARGKEHKNAKFFSFYRLENSNKWGYFQLPTSLASSLSLLFSFGLFGLADREVKGLSCNEGAAPQSVIINHRGCQAAPRTHSDPPGRQPSPPRTISWDFLYITEKYVLFQSGFNLKWAVVTKRLGTQGCYVKDEVWILWLTGEMWVEKVKWWPPPLPQQLLSRPWGRRLSPKTSLLVVLRLSEVFS